MGSKIKRGTAPSQKVREETERYRRRLRRLIEQHGMSQRELEQKMNVGRGFISRLLARGKPFPLEHLYAVLEALGVPPETFFASLYDEAPSTRAGRSLVERYADAPAVLGSVGVLRPGTLRFDRHYISRSWDASTFLDRARGARQAGRAFHGLVAGQRGVGLSTGIHCLLAVSRLGDQHRVVFLNLRRPVTKLQILWAMSAALVDLLTAAEQDLPEPLRAHVDAWEIPPDLPTLFDRLDDGAAPPAASAAPPLSELVDALAREVREHLGVRPLLVLDGWTRWELPRLVDLLDTSLDEIERPELSTVLAIPTALLYEPVKPRIEHRTTLVPPVPLYHDPSSLASLTETARCFFDELIRRYLPLDQVTDDARESLCHLSAGLPGEMIARTREACIVAAKHGSRQVDAEAVAKVWKGTTSRLHLAMKEGDPERLAKIAADPFGESVDDLPRLLQMNLVLLQPGYGGWLTVHPALRRLLEKKA